MFTILGAAAPKPPLAIPPPSLLGGILANRVNKNAMITCCTHCTLTVSSVPDVVVLYRWIKSPHDRRRDPIFDYRCRTCAAVFNLFTGTIWSGTHYDYKTLAVLAEKHIRSRTVCNNPIP